jgi:hypothetical protein
MQHRIVMERILGRFLERHEHVHHINGVRNDNRPENLEIMHAGDHARVSIAAGVKVRADIRAELEHLRAELAEYRRRYGQLTKE